MYFYKRTEPQLFTVGYEDANGEWHTDSDHSTSKEAADRASYLNGENQPCHCHAISISKEFELFKVMTYYDPPDPAHGLMTDGSEYKYTLSYNGREIELTVDQIYAWGLEKA